MTKNLWRNGVKASWLRTQARIACQWKRQMPKSVPMRSLAANVSLAMLGLVLATAEASAQTMAPTPNQSVSQTAQLQELMRKIDEQNAKIDMLSQQILKLQLEVTNHRPGVMIGEGAQSTSASTSTPTTSTSTSAA